MHVGLAYNIKSGAVTCPPDAEAEFDDEGTISAIKRALEGAGHSVGLYEADAKFPARLIKKRPDIVFNIAEGANGRGREAQVPAILSFLGIPYSGSDETAMCLAMDKYLAKTVLSAHGVRTPKSAVYKPAEINTKNFETALAFPVIVKPNAEGSGKGITDVSTARTSTELNNLLTDYASGYYQDALVEEFVEGREFTVGLLGNGERTRVFPPMEIIFRDKSRNIYSYETKRDFKRHIDYKSPPDIGAGACSELCGTALSIFKVLECRDFARIDFRMDGEGRLYFIEINPLPGLAPGYSDYPMLAEFGGVGYDDLIREILNGAVLRHGI